MYTEIEAVARKAEEAWKNRDAQALARMYAGDAVVADPLAGLMRGRDAVQRDAVEFFRAFSNTSFEQLNVFAKDERNGAIEWRLRGTNTGPLATPGGELPATGKDVDIEVVGVWSLDESGLITREKRYYDVAALLAQLGLMGGPSEGPASGSD